MGGNVGDHVGGEVVGGEVVGGEVVGGEVVGGEVVVIVGDRVGALVTFDTQFPHTLGHPFLTSCLLPHLPPFLSQYLFLFQLLVI